jgi:hypothetical protein
MPNDISLAVGDGARRMTCAELAAVRGISASSAERIVCRKRRPRQVGNDGIVRVLVPLTETHKRKDRAASDVLPDKDTDVEKSAGTVRRPPDVRPGYHPGHPDAGKCRRSPREQLAKANVGRRGARTRPARREDRRLFAHRIDQLMTLLTDRKPRSRPRFR